ncbi:MAG TPA: hypothetical protein VHJ19_09180, partial [Gammaproteobacteria bacterium]|nr:hypothetical protein [Gammaproteobacteria bacterium]
TPYNARARVVVSHPLKRPEFDAELNVKNLKLETVDKKLPPTTLRLTAYATGAPNDLKLYAQATAHDPKYGTLKLAFEGEFAKQIATINKFRLSSSERPTRLEAAGQIALQGKQSQVDFNAHWEQLRWPLSGNPQFASGKGHIRAKGDIAALSAQLSADISGTALTQAGIKKAQTIEASFRGGFANKTKTLTIDKLAVALSEQRLLAQGRLLLAGKQPEIRMQTHWRHVRWPLAGQPQVMSPIGAIKVSGTPSNLKAKLDIGVGEDGRIEGKARRAGDNIKLALDWRKLRWPLTGVAKVKSSRGSLDAKGTIKAMRARLIATLGSVALINAGSKATQTLKVNFSGGFNKPKKLLTIDKLSGAFAQQELMSHGHVSLAGKQPRVDLRARWKHVRWPLAGKPMITSPSGEVMAQGTPEDLQAKLNIGVGKTGRVTGSTKRAGDHLDLALNWRQLRWPLTKPQVISPTGELIVAGTLKDYRAKLNAQVNAPKRTNADISLTGQGSMQALHLNRIDIKALQGQLTGSARVAWKRALQGKVALNAQGLNPGQLLADWPGKLGLTVRAEAGVQGDRLVAHTAQLNVRGRLRDYLLKLNARGAYDGKGLKLDQFALVSSKSRLRAQGLIGDMLDIAWRIESPDLGQLLPHAAGRLRGEGNVQGSVRQPRIEARLSGNKFSYHDFHLQDLNLNAGVDLSGKSQSHVALALANGQAGDIALDRLVLNGEGDLAAHSFTLTARTSTGNADIAFNGALKQPWQPSMRWRFKLDQATLKYPQLAAWRLASPVTGQLSAKRAELDHGCWASGDARLCLQGSRSPASMQGMVEVKDLAFNYFARLLPPDARLEGSVSGRGEFDQFAGDQLAATVHVRTTAGRIANVVSAENATVSAERGASAEAATNEALTLLRFRPSTVDFQLGERGMRLLAALRLTNAGGIHVEAAVPEGSQPLTERPLSGHITMDLPDLSFIGQLAPDVGHFEGRLAGDMRLVGSIVNPQARGRVALTNALAVLNGPGLRVKNIQAMLAGAGRSGIHLEASARSGGGTLNVGGQLMFASKGAPRTNIHIRGQNFQVFNTVDARV